MAGDGGDAPNDGIPGGGRVRGDLLTANASLGVPMAWTSAYNQILCPAFLLGAFYFLLRWLESGLVRDYAIQALLFVLGFGALSTTSCIRPSRRRGWCSSDGGALAWLAPLAAISVAYFWLHHAVAPASAPSGPYAFAYRRGEPAGDARLVSDELDGWNPHAGVGDAGLGEDGGRGGSCAAWGRWRCS
ncbi:MAG: hypothetical protein R2762_13385 [Bryobacteraceae bacterium]